MHPFSALRTFKPLCPFPTSASNSRWIIEGIVSIDFCERFFLSKNKIQ